MIMKEYMKRALKEKVLDEGKATSIDKLLSKLDSFDNNMKISFNIMKKDLRKMEKDYFKLSSELYNMATMIKIGIGS